MITKIYWIARVFGYIACLGGAFLFLAHQADADPQLKNAGLAAIGIGFVAFFASYTLRAWLRFGSGRKTNEPGP